MNFLKRIGLSLLAILPIGSLSHAGMFGVSDLKNKNERDVFAGGKGLMIDVINPMKKRTITMEEAWENMAFSNPKMSVPEIDNQLEEALISLEKKGVIIHDDVIMVAGGQSEIPPDEL